VRTRSGVTPGAGDRSDHGDPEKRKNVLVAARGPAGVHGTALDADQAECRAWEAGVTFQFLTSSTPPIVLQNDLPAKAKRTLPHRGAPRVDQEEINSASAVGIMPPVAVSRQVGALQHNLFPNGSNG
jgi:hypothetical protein